MPNLIGKVSEAYRLGMNLSIVFFQELPEMDKPMFLCVLGLIMGEIRQVFREFHTSSVFSLFVRSGKGGLVDWSYGLSTLC